MSEQREVALRPDAVPRRGRVSTQQIIEVAAHLFASDGYHEIGMREIAQALGIRGASLYHHSCTSSNARSSTWSGGTN